MNSMHATDFKSTENCHLFCGGKGETTRSENDSSFVRQRLSPYAKSYQIGKFYVYELSLFSTISNFLLRIDAPTFTRLCLL